MNAQTGGGMEPKPQRPVVSLLFVYLLEPRCDCVAVNGDFMPDTTELHAQKIINYSKLSAL